MWPDTGPGKQMTHDQNPSVGLLIKGLTLIAGKDVRPQGQTLATSLHFVTKKTSGNWQQRAQ